MRLARLLKREDYFLSSKKRSERGSHKSPFACARKSFFFPGKMMVVLLADFFILRVNVHAILRDGERRRASVLNVSLEGGVGSAARALSFILK